MRRKSFWHVHVFSSSALSMIFTREASKTRSQHLAQVKVVVGLVLTRGAGGCSPYWEQSRNILVTYLKLL